MIDNLKKIQNNQADPEEQTVAIPLKEYKCLIHNQVELNLAELLAANLTSYKFYEALEAIGWMTYDKRRRCDGLAPKEV